MDSISESIPSFYEILMQDRLNEMLWQSVKMLTNVLTDKIAFFTPLQNYVEEISSFLCASLDLFTLLKTKGTFTENFYSLCRNITTNRQIFAYLFIHYALPLARIPILEKIYDLAKGFCMMGFLYFGFPYFSPEFYVLKQKLLKQKTKYSMSYVFILLLIGTKIVELYFSSRKTANSAVLAVNLDPPYQNSVVSKGTCQICKQKWANPTALTCSGYIFCYTCIRTHVQIFSACPVTKIKASIRTLRKIHV